MPDLLADFNQISEFRSTVLKKAGSSNLSSFRSLESRILNSKTSEESKELKGIYSFFAI
jgi:hypothetical protein